eukprot:14763054-Alexandrium_andersonii.AAC.1
MTRSITPTPGHPEHGTHEGRATLPARCSGVPPRRHPCPEAGRGWHPARATSGRPAASLRRPRSSAAAPNT